MYENQTDQTLKQRILERIPSDIDKSEGSFTYDAIAPAAVELAQMYIELDGILDKAFAQTSSGEWLEKRAQEYGVYRKTGTSATGKVEFKGADGTVIREGTLVQTDAGLKYTTKGLVIITGGVATAEVIAIAEGNKYNVPSKTISLLPVQLTGVIGVENSKPIAGGTDAETDKDFLQRLLLKTQTPATSGNVHHYKQWALEEKGIGDAKVFPAQEGTGGTVKVVVVDSNRLPVGNDSELLKNVKDKIESLRPVCVKVSVESARELLISVSATVELEGNSSLEAVEKEFRIKLTEYLKSITFAENRVSYSKINNELIETTGVKDIFDLKVNDTKDNIELSEIQCPVVGGIDLKPSNK